MEPTPETDDRIVHGRSPTIVVGAAIVAVAAVVALYGCRIGGDDAEASTPPPAIVATTATGAAATPIPTATATRIPEGSPTSTPVPVSPTERSTPVIRSPTPAPAATATPTRSAETARGSVGRVASARSVDGLQRPVDAADNFAPGERVYVSAELTGVRAEAILGIRWKRGGDEIFVYETPPQSAFSRGYFAFFFDPGGMQGEYEAEILIDGVVLGTVSFTVSG